MDRLCPKKHKSGMKIPDPDPHPLAYLDLDYFNDTGKKLDQDYFNGKYLHDLVVSLQMSQGSLSRVEKCSRLERTHMLEK